MGMFSSKKKTYVNTSVSRMVEDEDIKSTSQTAVIEYVLQGSIQVESDINVASLTDKMLQAHQNSITAKWNRIQDFAKDGKYHYGAVKGSVVYQSSKHVMEKIAAVVSSIEGQPVSMVYGLLGDVNPYHCVLQELVNLHGYNTQTNVLDGISAWVGKPCYLVDVVMHYTTDTEERVENEDYYTQYGLVASAGYTPVRPANPKAIHSDYLIDASTSEDYGLVTYGYMEEDKWVTKSLVVHLDKYIVSGSVDAMEGMGDEASGSDQTNLNEDDYVLGGYTVTKDGVEVFKLFTYVYGSGTHPSLDTIYSDGESTGQYYPRIYARLGNTDLANDKFKDTDAYKSSMEIAKFLGLTWDGWVEQIHDNTDKGKDIYQAYMTMALAANTKDPAACEYLYKYFETIYTSSMLGVENVVELQDTIATEYITGQTKQGSTILISDDVFTQSLSFSKIGAEYVRGVVTEVGKYTHDYVTTTVRVGLWRNTTTTFHAYRFQATENTYKEIRVYDLTSKEQVSGGYWTSSSGTSENLLVPLDRAVLKRMSSRVAEIVTNKSLHIIFNTLKVVKTKWYQSGVFKVVLFIAAVVMSVVTGGQSITLYALAVAAAHAVIVGIVLTTLAKIAVAVGINVQIVMVVAVIAMAYAGYMKLNNVKDMMGVTAKQLVLASNSALNFTTKISEQEVAKIAKKQEEFAEFSAGKTEDLNDLKKQLLSDPDLIDGLMFTDISPPDNYHYLNLYQTPNDYYNRTVHAGNPGVVAFDLISTYVDNALALPTINETLSSLQGSN